MYNSLVELGSHVGRYSLGTNPINPSGLGGEGVCECTVDTYVCMYVYILETNTVKCIHSLQKTYVTSVLTTYQLTIIFHCKIRTYVCILRHYTISSKWSTMPSFGCYPLDFKHTYVRTYLIFFWKIVVKSLEFYAPCIVFEQYEAVVASFLV